MTTKDNSIINAKLLQEYNLQYLKENNDLITSVKKETAEQLILSGVRFELPGTKEIESRLKHVVDESFEDYEVVEKREYSLGFRACFNWLKIKQMKSKGN